MPWLVKPFVKGRSVGAGPLQLNWYNKGFRVHLTWPRCKTYELVSWQ